jgi:radical SAM superfamily enzyme YgiQ (UPF0313 family)
MSRLDMLIVSMPVLDLQYPPSSPAIIKACVQAAGYTARTLDLNMLLKDICGSTDRFLQVQYNFENVGPTIVDTTHVVDAFFNNDKDIINQWIDHSIAQIKKYDPVWLGVSVFSYKSHKATLALCIEIKRQLPNIKIVLGGRGASSFALGPDHSQFHAKIEKFLGKYPHKNFGETLLHYKLADKIIQGDGEQAVIDLLNGSNEDNIKAQLKGINLETLPFVDFDDYDLAAYEYINELTIPITGSKGCVRKCTFCDIPVLWPEFKFRSGEHIANEMIHLLDRYGVKKFYMSDSLVNGSLKAFKDFTSTLANYNTANQDRPIKWVGQYITRPRSAVLNDHYYDQLKLSGGEGLTIGVESGSDSVRAHMKKQFTTADIDHELAEFDRRGIVCVLLFFSCYPTETWQDFMDTVDMFIRYQKYCASGTVYKLTLGTPYTHHAQTPLWNMQEQIGLTSEKGSDILWQLNSNKELTFRERVRRRLILQEVATALKLPMSRNAAELNQLTDSLQLHHQSIDSFFGNTPDITLVPDYYGLTPYDSLLMPKEIQEQLHGHIVQHPELIEKILKLHAVINDDIQFDNQSYQTLKQILTTKTYEKHTTQ